MRKVTAKEPLTRDEFFEAMKQFVRRGGRRNPIEPTLCLFPQPWLITFKDADMWTPDAFQWTKLAVGDTMPLGGMLTIVVPASVGFHLGFIEDLEKLLPNG